MENEMEIVLSTNSSSPTPSSTSASTARLPIDGEDEENIDGDFTTTPEDEMDEEEDVGEENEEVPETTDAPTSKLVKVKSSKRRILYSENSYGLLARGGGRHTIHLTIECLVSVPAQVLVYDDALCGFLPLSGHTICNVNLLQQITCQQTLSPSLIQPAARNSWSADHSVNNTLATPSVTKVTPIWEYSIQCQRKSDTKTLVECTLAPHMTYICSLPTFHHFRIGDRKFALSFGSDYSASKFHNKIQKALSHLSRQTIAGSGDSNLDASDDLDDDVFATDSNETPSIIRQWPQKAILARHVAPVCPAVSVTNHLNEEIDFYAEDDLAMPLCSMRPTTTNSNNYANSQHDSGDGPPMDPEYARPDVLSLATVSPCVNCHKCYGSPNFLSSISSSINTDNTNLSGSEPKKLNLTPKGSNESECFKPKLVQSSSSGATSAQEKALRFAKMRSIRSSSNPGSIMLIQKLSAKNSRDNEISKSKSLLESHLRSSYNTKEAAYSLRNASFELVQREFCFYCTQWYNVKDNKKGACPEAPDAIEKFIKKYTLYSWASKFVNKKLQTRQNDPCTPVCDPSCFTSETTQSFRRKAWFSLLACLFPCLCCYVPLTKIYHSEIFYAVCTCCGRCSCASPISQPNNHHHGQIPSSTNHNPMNRRNHRRHLLRTSKHFPVSQKLNKSNNSNNNNNNNGNNSKRHFDQLHSRTSSSQQILNDSYLNFKTVSGYGSLLQGSLDGGPTGISSDKPSGGGTGGGGNIVSGSGSSGGNGGAGEVSRTDKCTRRLVSRLSF
uniref:WH1 domain-containing protein n=1 Tax=Panagrolaimus sp. ES5 TaxID=591445 RepID=A0AC34F0Q4_9BILA